MEEIKIEKYYQNDAKRLIDEIFSAGAFRENITRDGIQGIEDLVAYYLQTYAETSRKMAKWSANFEKNGTKNAI